jgi:hypothetical protein
MLPDLLQKSWQALPPRAARLIAHAASFVAGLLIALMLHYLLYRISLPGTPFIYVVF